MIPASPSPSVTVPVPFSNAANVDRCHMLTFLYLASKHGFEVTSAQDQAAGVMTNNERGIAWMKVPWS